MNRFYKILNGINIVLITFESIIILFSFISFFATDIFYSNIALQKYYIIQYRILLFAIFFVFLS